MFIGASKESVLGKVFRKNMDKDSVNSDFKKMIDLALSNSKTALYFSEQLIKNSQEYKNCQVKKVNVFLYSFSKKINNTFSLRLYGHIRWDLLE